MIEDQGQDLGELEKRVSEFFTTRWANAVRKAGYGEVNTVDGIKIDRVKDDKGIGSYVSKVSYDLTRSDKKTAKQGGMNQWQLLREARITKDPRLYDLWREYVLASKGRRCIEWSRGLKKRVLGYDEDEDLTDDEIASQATEDPPLAQLGGKLSSYLGNRVEAKIAALRGIEHNGADGLRHALVHDQCLRIETSWTTYTPRGSPEGEAITIPYLELVS